MTILKNVNEVEWLRDRHIQELGLKPTMSSLLVVLYQNIGATPERVQRPPWVGKQHAF